MAKLKLLSLLLVLILTIGFSMFSVGDLQAGCFSDFEKCINNVRTSFFGGFFDFLDCELELVACIKEKLI